jgi:hypothetical protein
LSDCNQVVDTHPVTHLDGERPEHLGCLDDDRHVRTCDTITHTTGNYIQFVCGSVVVAGMLVVVLIHGSPTIRAAILP